MKRTIIVTDLTRFNNQTIVCTAGIDRVTGECIRPMPYLQGSECKRLKLLPGALLAGDFTLARNVSGPHREDHHYSNLRFEGPCTAEQFRNVLIESCFPGVEAGFEIKLPAGQKYLPAGHPVQRSIITIAVAPMDLRIVEDKFNPGKIKLHFKDGSGHPFGFISVTDLGFHDYAMKHHDANDLMAVNHLLQSQNEVFLRIGLSREYAAEDGRKGYWLQANGIYSFPMFHEGIRSYAP
jgi:hypothetical protein